MTYFVYVREAETGKVMRFGAYDEPPMIVAKDGTHFIEVPNFANIDLNGAQG